MTNLMTITPIEDELLTKWTDHIRYGSGFSSSMEFVETCIEKGYALGSKLYRLDSTLPWGPDNIRVAGGEVPPQRDDEWALKWNKTVNRLRRHWGLEPFPEG